MLNPLCCYVSVLSAYNNIKGFFYLQLTAFTCIIYDMNTRRIPRTLLSAGLATAVALGTFAAQPIASAQTAPFEDTVQTQTDTGTDSGTGAGTDTGTEDNTGTDTGTELSSLSSSSEDADPETILDWLGVATAGLSVIATLYTLLTSMGKNIGF